MRSFRNLKRLASSQQKEKYKNKDKKSPSSITTKTKTTVNQQQPTKCTASSSRRSNSVNVTLESYTDSYTLRRQSTTSILSSVFKPSSTSTVTSPSKPTSSQQQRKKSQVAFIQTSTGLVQQLSSGRSSGGLNAQLISNTTTSSTTYKLTNALASSMRTSTAFLNSDKSETKFFQTTPIAVVTTTSTSGQTTTSSFLNQPSIISATAFHLLDNTINMDNLDKRSIDNNRTLDNSKNNQQSDFKQQATTVNIGDQTEPANSFVANQQIKNINNVSTANNLSNNLLNQTITDTASDLKSDSKQQQQTELNSNKNENINDNLKLTINKESTTINLTSATTTTSGVNKVGYTTSKYPQPTTTPANSPPLNEQPILLNYVGVQHQPNLPMRNVLPLSAHHSSQPMNTETILHTAAGLVTANAAASALSSQLQTAPLNNQRSLQSGSNDSDCSGRQQGGKRSKNSLENFHLPNEVCYFTFFSFH